MVRRLTGSLKPEPRRRAWGTSRSVWRKPAWIVRLVQILVVVANIQMRTLKTEVEKGSM